MFGLLKKQGYVDVGRVRLRLARGSRLAEYQANYQRYDKALAEIARICYQKYPALCAIDIGANVGDTAALIQRDAPVPVLCIEGDPQVTPILKDNATLLRDIEIVETFVGEDGLHIDLKTASEVGTNASLVSAISSDGIALKSLRTILAEHPRFAQSKLVKTDTQGFDFRIIMQSLDYINATKPVIYLEYDPSFNPAKPQEGLEALDALNGYRFLYYDNFGNFMGAANDRERRADLHGYLKSNRRFGTVVYYFDVCAVHEEDTDVYDAILRHERSLVK